MVKDKKDGSDKKEKDLLREQVTHLKKRVNELEEEVKKRDNILNKIPAHVYILDMEEMESVWSNEKVSKFLGFNPRGLSVDFDGAVAKSFHREDLDIIKEAYEYLDENPAEDYFGVFRLKDKSGKVHYFNSATTLLSKLENGKAKRILGIAMDITGQIKSDKEVRMLLSEDLQVTHELLDMMSERELQVLQLLADGFSYEDLAKKLNLSIDGVRYHIRNIYQKLGVNSRIDAIREGIRYRIINT